MPASIPEHASFRGWFTASGQPIGPEEWASARALIRGETSVGEVIEIERFDGTRALVLNSAVPLRDAAGTVVGAVVTVLDATERIAAERRSHERARQLETVLDHLPVGVWFTDAAGRISRGNPAGKRIWGGARWVEVEQYHAYKAWRPETGRRIESHEWALARAVEAGQTTLGELLEIESFDGARKFIRNSAVPIRDDDGTILGGVVINEDATEAHRLATVQRLMAEVGRALTVSLDMPIAFQQLAELLVPALGDGAVLGVFDEAGVVRDPVVHFQDPSLTTRARDAARRFPASLEGTRLLAELQGSGRSALANQIDAARWRELTGSEELALTAEQLGLRSGIVAPLKHRGRMLGLIAVCSLRPEHAYGAWEVALLETLADRIAVVLDNARLYEALRLADRRKDEFLAMLSHELRNPLAPIRNSVFVLRRSEPGSAPSRRALDIIDRQSTHLTGLVDDLLDVTRIARGKIELDRDDLDLAAVVRQTTEDHRPLLEDHGLHLELRTPSLPIPVRGDRIRIVQVVGNLLHNALRFTGSGGRVEVSVERDGAMALLRVKDDGIGLEPEALGRVFEPFFQAATPGKAPSTGLGMGLALVRGLTELHGGRVRARSEGEGRGTEVCVELPLDEGTLRAPRPESASPAGPRRRVLVVEDNPDVSDSLKDALELFGHEVRTAGDAAGGLEEARAMRPDVVICDVGLPDVDGYELARRLRSEPLLAGVRLLALTGHALPEDQRRAAEAGFDRHLAKPPDLLELERILADG